MRLYIASGQHVDTNLSERVNQVTSKIGQPNLVFVEGGSSAFGKDQLKALAGTLLIAPLLGLAIIVQIYVFIEGVGRLVSMIAGESTGKDIDVVNKLTSQYDISSKEVDIGPAGHIFDHQLAWGVANWGATIGISYFLWPIRTTNSELFTYLIYLLLGGYGFLLVLLTLTHSKRNEHIASEIASKSEDVDTACLITGEAHHAAVGNQLKNSPKIDVVNPEPDDPGTTTKLFLVFHRAFQRMWLR